MLYKGCKLYSAKDKKKTAVALIDIESDKPLYTEGTFGEGSSLDEGSTYTVTTTTPFDYKAGIYQLSVPGMGDYKITGYTKIQENQGVWKRKYRYTLTLQG
jgi:hypothetical protein